MWEGYSVRLAPPKYGEKKGTKMLKKTITYTDYNGVERTEDFYFNISKSEIVNLELSVNGGWHNRLQKIIDAKDVPSLAHEFRELLRMSYGVKSDDGKRFIKNPELFDEFSQSEAYEQLFMELITDEKAAAEFVNNIVPKQESSRQDVVPASK